MQKPTNAAASEIVRILSVNNDINAQISTLQSITVSNLEIIEALSITAMWEEVPDPEPLPDPLAP